MIHKEDICEASKILMQLLEAYDDNHPEVISKADIAEVLIYKLVKLSGKTYREGIGILQECILGLSEEWENGEDPKDFDSLIDEE